ncbi:MAG: nuclear transport factor 2 family protein [Betaproteobacteria bacterium]|nr:nuclear transport factor 2 family protein [Betaproteobacteria bacterium]
MTVDEIVRYFETLDEVSLGAIDRVYTEDAYFKDPFNEVRRREDIRSIYARMFESLLEPRFSVVNRIAEGDQLMLEWDFTFSIRRFRPRQTWRVHGATHLRLASDGRIRYHRDFWDTGEELYAHLPLLGPVIRRISRALG